MRIYNFGINLLYIKLIYIIYFFCVILLNFLVYIFNKMNLDYVYVGCCNLDDLIFDVMIC